MLGFITRSLWVWPQDSVHQLEGEELDGVVRKLGFTPNIPLWVRQACSLVSEASVTTQVFADVLLSTCSRPQPPVLTWADVDVCLWKGLCGEKGQDGHGPQPPLSASWALRKPPPSLSRGKRPCCPMALLLGTQEDW